MVVVVVLDGGGGGGEHIWDPLPALRGQAIWPTFAHCLLPGSLKEFPLSALRAHRRFGNNKKQKQKLPLR